MDRRREHHLSAPFPVLYHSLAELNPTGKVLAILWKLLSAPKGIVSPPASLVTE